MGIPVVIKAAGGMPVTVATSGYGLPMEIATNGFGIAVTQAANGLPATGITFAAAAPFYGTLLKKASDQIAADYTTATAITFDSEVYDTDAFHDVGSSTSRITIPSSKNAQWVVLCGQVHASSITASTAMQVWFAKNGSPDFDGNTGRGVDCKTALDAVINIVSHPILVATGDYFELVMKYVGDASITVQSADTTFGMRIIGSAFSGAVVGKSADATLQNYSTFPLATWNADVYDPDAMHDLVTNTDRIVIPAAYTGRKAIARGSYYFTSVTANQSTYMEVNKSGVQAPGSGFSGLMCGNDTNFLNHTYTAPLDVVTNDYFNAVWYSQDTSITAEKERSFLSVEIMPASFKGVLCQFAADKTANYQTPTVVAWDGVDIYDTDGAHDHSSSPSNTKIIVPSAWNGRYGVAFAVFAGVTATALDLQYAQAAILRNGSGVYAGVGSQGGHTGAFTEPYVSVSTQPLLLATGDEFTAQFFFQGDVSVGLESTKSCFGMYLVGG